MAGFFLDGVADTAQQAVTMAQQGLALFARDRNRIAQRGARAGNAGLVFGQFARRVLVGVPQVQSLQSLLALSAPTILTAIRTLQDMEIVNELTGQRRHRVSLISVTSKSSAKARSRCEPCPGKTRTVLNVGWW